MPPGNPSTLPHTMLSGPMPMPYNAALRRVSLVGSGTPLMAADVPRLSPLGAVTTPCLASTYSSRLPLPLVSRIRAVQPCDFCSSWVWSHILVFSQPTTPPPPPLLVQSVLFASCANRRWCVAKQVSINDTCLVAGSYTASWR